MFVYFFKESGGVIKVSEIESIEYKSDNIGYIFVPDNHPMSPRLFNLDPSKMQVIRGSLMYEGKELFDFNDIKEWHLTLMKDANKYKENRIERYLKEYLSIQIERLRLGVNLTYPITFFNSDTGQLIEIANENQLRLIYSKLLDRRESAIRQMIQKYMGIQRKILSSKNVEELQEIEWG